MWNWVPPNRVFVLISAKVRFDRTQALTARVQIICTCRVIHTILYRNLHDRIYTFVFLENNRNRARKLIFHNDTKTAQKPRVPKSACGFRWYYPWHKLFSRYRQCDLLIRTKWVKRKVISSQPIPKITISSRRRGVRATTPTPRSNHTTRWLV